MKKILVVTLITSFIMLAGMGAVVYLLTKDQASQEDINRQQQVEELDIIVEGKNKENINQDEMVVLNRAGAGKNVETFPNNNVKMIYNVEKSKQIKDKLNKMKRKSDFSFDAPLWAYNPFGTNILSMYLFFRTNEPTYLKYTISVTDAAIPDFTRTLYNGMTDNVSKTHEYQLTGFIPGMDNYIVLNLYNSRNQMIKRVTYKIDLSDIKPNTSVKLATTTGKSTTQLTNGLFYVLGMKNKDNKNPAIYMYDNSGILRGYIPLMNEQSDSIEFVDNSMIYSYGISKFARVSPLGQVINTYNIGKYRQYHDFTTDGFGHLLIIATDTKKTSKTVQDIIISLDLTTGKVKKIVDMEKLMPDLLKAAKKVNKSKVLNWIQLNSISMIAANDIVVSAREISSVIRINQINSENPKIQYIIAEPALLDKSGYEDKLYDKAFINGEDKYYAQFGQTSIVYEEDATLPKGKYYLCLFNNNFGYWGTKPKFNWNQFTGIGRKNSPAEHSMYYQYLVDENQGTYELIKNISVPYSSLLGSVDNYKGNHVINSGKAAIYGEYDSTGKLIREFKADTRSDIKHVYKYDMKEFWYH